MGLRGSVEYKFICIYTEKICVFNDFIIFSYIVIKDKNFILCTIQQTQIIVIVLSFCAVLFHVLLHNTLKNFLSTPQKL